MRLRIIQPLRFILFVTLISYLLLEAALWLFFPVTAEKKITYRQHLPGLQNEVTYSTNSFGFRSLSMKTRKKPKNVIRIFALGASTTDQMNQSTQDLWSALLETRLNEHFASSGKKIEVAAWGRGGEKVFDRVRFVHQELAQYEPDIVLTLEGINDLCWNGGPGYVYDSPAARVLGTNHKKVWWVNKLKHKYSQLDKRLTLIQQAREQEEKVRQGKMLEYHTDSLVENHKKYMALPFRAAPERQPDPIIEFEDGIRTLGTESKTQGFKIIYLTQPVLWQTSMADAEKNALWFYVNTPDGPVRPDTAWAEHEMNRYNDLQMKEASRIGAVFVPLHTLIPKTTLYFFDDCHFTDLGNKAVAEAIYSALELSIDNLK